ncbi:MAG: ATP-binding cassette domain-containing protein [Treponema sp.]|nr:ATP-binding cassette domain-containing protein [Treponema sp.]
MDIALSHVSKRYLHKVVLENLSVAFKGGMIHALLGENGAGKSTTAAILSGGLQYDEGSILINGNVVHFETPRDAVRAGIVCVQQRPLLAGSISVIENILLGSEYSQAGKKLKRREILQEAEKYRQKWAPQLDFRARVAGTGGDERFYTSLIAALICRPSVLILDEPSALLDWEQRRALYANIRELACDGMNIIVITHIMQEAELYTDTITVLRKGKAAEQYDHNSIFTGTNLSPEKETGKDAGSEKGGCNKTYCSQCGRKCAVSFSGITVRPKKRPAVYDVSFTAECGIITLIKGLQESGLGTLENVVTGMETARAEGTLTIKTPAAHFERNLKFKKLTPYFLRYKTGLRTAIIPSDRTFRASHPDLSIGQLLCAMHNGMVNKDYSDSLIKKAGVTIQNEEKASALSGGMLQRLIQVRELDTDPLYIIACEPLQGLDAQSSERTVKQLVSFAEKGCIVLVLSSSDFPDELCGSVYKLTGGTITGGRK